MDFYRTTESNTEIYKESQKLMNKRANLSKKTTLRLIAVIDFKIYNKYLNKISMQLPLQQTLREMRSRTGDLKINLCIYSQKKKNS